MESHRLAEYSLAVRESTVKRLKQVPKGFQNWRLTRESLSVAEIAAHLLEADEWLFKKLKDTDLPSFRAAADEKIEVSDGEFEDTIDKLSKSGVLRFITLRDLTPEFLSGPISDTRFGDVTVWCVIVRGNLDHECHHRGQLSAYLRAIDAR